MIYPGLPSHPQHELAKAQMKGFGGMVTFYVKVPLPDLTLPSRSNACSSATHTRHTQGELEQAKQFLENLHIFHLAESLGSVESLVDFPYGAVSHASPLSIGVPRGGGDESDTPNAGCWLRIRPIMTHAAVPKEEREKLGISDTLVRLSVGVEDLDDLVRDLENALAHVQL